MSESAVQSTLTRPGWHKVPEITLLFWVVKLLSTAMGESFSDYLVFHVNPHAAVVAGSGGLAIALALQLRAARYAAPTYWLAVVMVAVFGSMVGRPQSRRNPVRFNGHRHSPST